MICFTCQHQQEDGKDCIVCGQAGLANTNTTMKSNLESTSRKKFLQKTLAIHNVCKQSSKIFDAVERHVTYGLLSIIAYLCSYSISIFVLTNHFYTSMINEGNRLLNETDRPSSLSLIPFTSSIFLFVFLFMTVAIVCIFFSAQLMRTKIPLQPLISQYGHGLLPFTALNMIAIGLGSMGAFGLTMFMIGLSLFFVIYIIPALTIYNQGIHNTRARVLAYWSMGTTAGSMIGSYIIVRLFLTYLLH